MSILKAIIAAAITLLLLAVVTSAAENTSRIYGKIITADGEEFEGLIRWDKNEGNWCDMLDGTKELDVDNLEKSSRRQYNRDRGKIKIFDWEIDNVQVNWDGTSAASGLAFGHIEAFEVRGDDALHVFLKSGESFELEGGSTDIGNDIREIIIEDIDEGEIEFVWDDIERIEFMQAKSGMSSNFGDRLYGTVTSRRGEEFTGFVTWDVDEIFTEDILDGEERGRSRKVQFGKIAAIERYSSSGSKVILKSGDELILRETNDVDEGNRGILVADDGFGQVEIGWSEFDKLVLKDPPAGRPYSAYDGGQPIYGTVTTADGDTYTGRIRWDNDEAYTWEILDGEYRGADYNIEFGKIKSIERRSYQSSTVVLLDNRELRLRGSNDVDEDNKGIFITRDTGDEVEVDWEDFVKLELIRK